MADRTFFPVQSLDRGVKSLYGEVTSAGATALSATDCQGFSVTRTGVGAYTITLEDRYPAASNTAATSPLLGVQANMVATGGAGGVGGALHVVADNSAAAAKTITVVWAVGATATDPTSGNKLKFRIDLRNTSAPRKGV
jgi:hypothetical protein